MAHLWDEVMLGTFAGAGRRGEPERQGLRRRLQPPGLLEGHALHHSVSNTESLGEQIQSETREVKKERDR